MNLFGETERKNEERKRFRFGWRRLLMEIVLLLLVAACFFAMRGIPMGGIPKPEEVQSAKITDYSLGIYGREFTEPDEIELAVKCCNLLSWKPGTPDNTEPEVELAFRLKDGSTIVFGGNETTAWRDGKAYRMKEEKNLFVNCVRGIFLLKESVEGSEH